MATTPITELQEAASAKIEGRVRAVKSLLSPCTGRSCVGFKATLIVGAQSLELSEVASFILDDGTGQALIAFDGREAVTLELDVDATRTIPASRINDIPVLRDRGLGLSDHLGVVIYDEAILAVDDTATVWGIAMREVLPRPALGPGAGYREAGDTIMRLTRSPAAPIRISSRRDRPRSGAARKARSP